MKKKLFLLTLFLTCIFTCKNVYAFDSNNYKYKNLCGNYEVAGFHADGVIDPVKCFSVFEDAKAYMQENGARDLAVLGKVNGETKILDANMGLVDMTVKDGQLTYFYETKELNTRQYTYMLNSASYGGSDAGLMDTGWSNAKGKFTVKVRIGNFTGWIAHEDCEIVPITWVKSYSHYTVTDEIIRHNYIYRVQNDYRSTGGNTIGPKPTMLSPGVYYSYDGHYFYDNIDKLIKDYRNNTYKNAVNKDNPYYNYYMYLSNHTKTAYSSLNIDEYIRNNLGYSKDVYGHKASAGTSRLYGSGTYFYYAQQKYGVNAVLSLSLSRNETGNGRSYLAINKNNGFGLNAVDSNPINGASWYATFGYSILGYANKWITYGFAHPRDWRYFGPQFGDKWIGMNVKYASDTYWSETMAAHYYSLDKALGLQDYNYYQLGVLKNSANAYAQPSTSSKFIYNYPEAEDAVVILGEVTKNGEKWYKVQSDLNIDSNYNEITSGDYNWNGVVYVRASDIRKINEGKNGYVSPNDVTDYQDSNYQYNLYVENGNFNPRVGISTKNTEYYYDSTLTSAKGQTLLKDRYVIVYAAASLNNRPVAYLVTSDYYYSQKHWVSADSIKFTDVPYGKVTVDTDDNQYTWVNYNTQDILDTKISGLYTYAYVPVLSQQKVGNDIWYKVPVSLSTNDNVYGYTLAKYSNYISIELSTPIVDKNPPVITAVDKTIYEGQSFDPKAGVTASDSEDGDLTSKIEVTKNTVDTTKAGTYEVTYKVVDSDKQETTKTIKVTVKTNNAPVINASDKNLKVNDTFNALDGVTANDTEDGNITKNIKVTENTVNMTKAGTYKVVYSVTDQHGKTTTKEIKVIVVANASPVINAKNQSIMINTSFNPLTGVTASDAEDGDITKNIKVTKNNVNTKSIGTYEVTYEVVDSASNKTTKTIQVEVIGTYQEAEGEFYLESLDWNTSKNQFTISGYEIILNQDNVNKTYYLVLKDKNNASSYRIPIDRWENGKYNLGTENGHSYTDSWFKGTIDFSDIPNGDYELYMTAYSKNYYTTQKITNLFNKSITKRREDDSHGYNFKVLNTTKSKQMELEIRNEVYTTSQAPTYRKMVNEFEVIEFKNNKLRIQGYSYNYGGLYANQVGITRKIIFENVSTYNQTVIDVGSAKGPYALNIADKLDKTYAWYDKELDISKLEKGIYSIQVYTKTSNAEDYGELSDMFKVLKKTATINGKKYTITYNKERQNRLELTVE